MKNDFKFITGCIAIIPSAGVGKRFNKDLKRNTLSQEKIYPKQYHPFLNSHVLNYTLQPFLNSHHISKILLVVSKNDPYYSQLIDYKHKKLLIVEGGKERMHSVFNALDFLLQYELPMKTPILVHDAARPCLTEADLEQLIHIYKKKMIPCFLSTKIVDSVKRVNTDGIVVHSVNREGLVKALTPQMASLRQLHSALFKVLNESVMVTDEVSALLHSGLTVQAIEGQADNIKITIKSDLAWAEDIIRARK
jgi:2-C-methyl-D-erythritol 4-phosphate cytidylyltransferase